MLLPGPWTPPSTINDTIRPGPWLNPPSIHDGIYLQSQNWRDFLEDNDDLRYDEPMNTRRQNRNRPRSNQAQNEQTDAVANALRLSGAERQQLHNEVGAGDGLGFQEILELAKELFRR